MSTSPLGGWFWKAEGGGRLWLLPGMNDWDGVDPLGSAVETGGDGGGRGLLSIDAGGCTCTEAARDLLGTRESCKDIEIAKKR